MHPSDSIANDTLIGVDAIAAFLGVTKRTVYSMREAGHPLVKHEPGVGIVARKSALRRHFGVNTSGDGDVDGMRAAS